MREWCGLVQCRKAVFGWPSWIEVPSRHESPARARRAGRTPFISHEADRCTLTVLLADETSASLEGTHLRIMAWKRRSLEDVTAILETLYEGKPTCLARVDCHPRSPHTNQHWRKFGCPATIDGSHVHRFEENARVGRDAFHPVGNLPVAYPVEEEPQSFRDFVRLVGVVFAIAGLDDLPPPPTQEGMV